MFVKSNVLETKHIIAEIWKNWDKLKKIHNSEYSNINCRS